MTSFWQNFKLYIFVAIVAAMGAGGGMYAFKKATEIWKVNVKSAHSTRQSGRNIVAARKDSVKIEDAVAKGQAHAAAVRKAAAAHLAAQQAAAQEAARQYAATHPEEPPHETKPTVVDPSGQLDVDTVRLLNAARAGDSAVPAPSRDGQGNAPSGVEVGQLVDSDMDIAARYNELAARHNALVDWVDSVLKHQIRHPLY